MFSCDNKLQSAKYCKEFKFFSVSDTIFMLLEFKWSCLLSGMSVHARSLVLFIYRWYKCLRNTHTIGLCITLSVCTCFHVQFITKNYRQINWIIYRVNTQKTLIWLYLGGNWELHIGQRHGMCIWTMQNCICNKFST